MLNNSETSNENEPIVQYVDDSVNKNNCGKTLCDPRKWFFRYFGLVFMCFLSFGSYFCYDNVGKILNIIQILYNLNLFI